MFIHVHSRYVLFTLGFRVLGVFRGQSTRAFSNHERPETHESCARFYNAETGSSQREKDIRCPTYRCSAFSAFSCSIDCVSFFEQKISKETKVALVFLPCAFAFFLHSRVHAWTKSKDGFQESAGSGEESIGSQEMTGLYNQIEENIGMTGIVAIACGVVALVVVVFMIVILGGRKE